MQRTQKSPTAPKGPSLWRLLKYQKVIFLFNPAERRRYVANLMLIEWHKGEPGFSLPELLQHYCQAIDRLAVIAADHPDKEAFADQFAEALKATDHLKRGLMALVPE